MKYLLLASLLGTSISALAQVNGGNSGVCFNSTEVVKEIKHNGNRIANSHLKHIKSIFPLDLYEARAYHLKDADSKLDLPKLGETPEQFVGRIIKKLENLPALAKILNEKFSKINASRLFYTGGGIDRIYDTNESYYLDPESCVIATVVRQSKSDTGKVQLEFDQRLYNHNEGSLDTLKTQGVLLLHETVLRWAQDLGHTTADKARAMTAFLLQKNTHRIDVVNKLIENKFIIARLEQDKNAYCYESRELVPYDFTGTYSDICMNPNMDYSDMIVVLKDKNDSNPREGILIGNGNGAQPEYHLIWLALEKIYKSFEKNKNESLINEVRKVYNGSINTFSELESYRKRLDGQAPNCKEIIPQETIDQKKKEIESAQVRIAEISKLLERTFVSKKKQLQAEKQTLERKVAQLGKEIQNFEAQNAQVASCRANWETFVKEYAPKLDKEIARMKSVIEFEGEIQNSVYQTRNWIPSYIREDMANEYIPNCVNGILKSNSEAFKACRTFKIR